MFHFISLRKKIHSTDICSFPHLFWYFPLFCLDMNMHGKCQRECSDVHWYILFSISELSFMNFLLFWASSLCTKKLSSVTFPHLVLKCTHQMLLNNVCVLHLHGHLCVTIVYCNIYSNSLLHIHCHAQPSFSTTFYWFFVFFTLFMAGFFFNGIAIQWSPWCQCWPAQS